MTKSRAAKCMVPAAILALIATIGCDQTRTTATPGSKPATAAKTQASTRTGPGVKPGVAGKTDTDATPNANTKATTIEPGKKTDVADTPIASPPVKETPTLGAKGPSEKTDPRQDPAKPTAATKNELPEVKQIRLPPPDEKQFPGLKHLSKEFDVWFDPKQKRVVMQAEVCQRNAVLEVFACNHLWTTDPEGRRVRQGTKEHEAVLTINTTAVLVHTALLLAEANPGSPARFPPQVPEYQPAHGERIEVTLHWTDRDGKPHTARAQDWIRDTATKKPLDQPWVFGGSVFWVDEKTGQKHYGAEAGELICVSNFGTALMDLPIKSSDANEERLFEAFTERIPPAVFGLKVATVEGTCRISKIDADSPASRAGLKVGDVIEKIEFTPLAGGEEFLKELDKVNPGHEIPLTIRRDGKSQKIYVQTAGATVTVVLTPKRKQNVGAER